MLKVCVVIQNHLSAVMGGAQYQGHLLAEELARQSDVDVTYLTRGMCPERCKAMGISYEVKPIFRFRDFRNRSSFFDARGLYKALQELRPDVIYQQMRDSYTGVCALYARRAGVPFFFHIASDADLDTRWLPVRPSTRAFYEVMEAIAGKWGLLRAPFVIAQTARQDMVFQERFNRSATIVVRNFQPLPVSLPAKSDGPTRVFWVANLKAVKRPELFVRLAESFVGREDVQFLMAGRPSAMRRLAPLMAKIPTIPNLKYLGELSLDEVNRVMSQAHIHVNTSRYEGFPNTFIQAWAQGAVVVSVGVDPDAGMDRMGIGFCTHDFAELRAAIERLVSDPQHRQACAERAFKFAHAEHSMANATVLAQLMIREGHEAASRLPRAARLQVR